MKNSPMYLRSRPSYINHEFYHAITIGDVDKCNELLTSGNINLHWEGSGEGDCGHFTHRHHDGLGSQSQEVNPRTTTCPLQYAVMYRQPEIVKLLLRHGAEPDSADADGRTAIHTLVLYWPRYIPKDSDLLGESDQETAVYRRYLRAIDLLCLDTLRILCAFGGSPNARDNRQQSPLHYAARFDISSAVRLLVEYGGYLDARDLDRITPTMLAAATGHRSLEALVDSRVHVFNNIDLTCSLRRTALHYAVESTCPQHNKHSCVKRLLREGANPNAVDHNRQTPLHLACVSKTPADEVTIRYLLQAGADVDIRDVEGFPPLYLLLDNANNLLNIRLILDVVDGAVLGCGPPGSRLPNSLFLPGLEPLAQTVLDGRTRPPSMQRICGKVIRTRLAKVAAASNCRGGMAANVAGLPLPRYLQRMLLLDETNPIRQTILGMKVFQEQLIS